MSNLSLQAEVRPAKKVVAESKLPAVVYGRDLESTSISINEADFNKVFEEAGESTIFTLKLDGANHDVLVHDFQRDPVSHEVSHVDFYAIQKGQKITVSVPLTFVGESPVTDMSDVQLVYVLHDLEVECQPKDLPSEIEIDISSIKELGDVLHVSEVKLPADVVATLDPEEAVLSTSAVREVEEDEEDEGEDFDPSKIEVEGQEEETESEE